jgi:adenine-specific DNA-methyltransferase
MPSLNWIGRKAVENHHKEVPFHLLKCDSKLSVGDPGTGSLLVEGDNLLALKALLPYYAGEVKCIYIDPPYNTGNEKWVYNDNVNSPQIREWLGKVVGPEGEDLSRHDKWLCMMYPRLTLLRLFLRQDGTIIVSIDDHEASHLHCIMDEIFGRNNFIAKLVWEKGRKNDAKLFSVGHEYMLVYARSLSTLRKQKTIWREPKPGAKEIWEEYTRVRERFGDDHQAIEKALQEWYRSLPEKHPSRKLSRYRHVDKFGPWRDRDISWPGGGGPRYDVIHPLTKEPCVVPERGWGFATPDAMQRQIDLDLIQFREDHSKPPFRKAHLRPIPEELEPTEDTDSDEVDSEEVGMQVMPSVIYKQSQVTIKYLRKLMGDNSFENPKDHEVIARLVRYVTTPSGDDLVLDSFAGSGTTGHAVLRANSDDSGKRRFILVELEPEIAEKKTAERLKRVIQGVKVPKGNREEEFLEGIGGGFRYCTLGPTLFDANGRIRDEARFDELAQHVYFVETGDPLPRRTNGKTPLLGVCRDKAVYLLYNGILKDKSAGGGNALTRSVLASLPQHDGAKVIYGTRCLLSSEKLRRLHITFKQIPYAIKVE